MDVRLVADRYRLEHELGRGGMGTVWLADDQLAGRQVAVKELRPPRGLTGTDQETFTRRALAEARSAARIQHSNAVTLFDVIPATAADEAVYLIMEYVQGRTLAEVIRHYGGLGDSDTRSIGLQLLSILEIAHGLGIVHRDIKPANIMITMSGQAKLTDFGIAYSLGETRLTRSGTIGTQAYMAPELFESAPITPAVDLWSLGATLYYTAEGRGPFDRETTAATLHAILVDDLPVPSCAPDIAAAIAGLLTRDPSRRFSIAQARTALSGGQPDAARGDTGGARVPGDLAGTPRRADAPRGHADVSPPADVSRDRGDGPPRTDAPLDRGDATRDDEPVTTAQGGTDPDPAAVAPGPSSPSPAPVSVPASGAADAPSAWPGQPGRPGEGGDPGATSMIGPSATALQRERPTPVPAEPDAGADVPRPRPRLGPRRLTGAGLVAAGVIAGLAGLFLPEYARTALTSDPLWLWPHLLYLASWTAVAVWLLVPRAGPRPWALAGLGLGVPAIGLALQELANITVQLYTPGAGLTLGLVGLLACVAGAICAFTVPDAPGNGAPGAGNLAGPAVWRRALPPAAGLAAIIWYSALPSLKGNSSAFDAFGQSPWEGPGVIIPMLAFAAIAFASVRLPAARARAAPLAGAAVYLLAVAVQDIVTVLTVRGDTLGTLTSSFWLYCAGAALVVSLCAWLTRPPRAAPD